MTKKLFNVDIDYKVCKSCGICYWVCPTHTIVEGELQFPKISDMGKCIGCMQCVNLCPDFAIEVTLKEAVLKNG